MTSEGKNQQKKFWKKWQLEQKIAFLAPRPVFSIVNTSDFRSWWDLTNGGTGLWFPKNERKFSIFCPIAVLKFKFFLVKFGFFICPEIGYENLPFGKKWLVLCGFSENILVQNLWHISRHVDNLKVLLLELFKSQLVVSGKTSKSYEVHCQFEFEFHQKKICNAGWILCRLITLWCTASSCRQDRRRGLSSPA